MSTATELDTQALVERFTLKAFVESCLVLEEGVATIRDIDLAMMTGFGILPGPFARADDRGLDDVLAALERAEAEWGEHFSPPLILRRLVASAISEIDSDDVLEARIAWPGVTVSSSENTACLISIFSGTASTTKSTSPKPS